MLGGEGDGQINRYDVEGNETQALTYSAIHEVLLTDDQGLINLDIDGVIRQAIADGKTRITLRLHMVDPLLA